MHIPHDTAVLVLDGRKLLLLRNEGDDVYPNLVVEHAREHADAPDRDLKTGPAGRSPGGPTPGASAVGEADFHRQNEERFAADAGMLLKEKALSNDFEALIIVAPPRTLGVLRTHYHAAVKARLRGEIDKDLTDHPIPEIEKAIKAA